MSLVRRVAVTVCAMTATTSVGTRLLGTRFFLPGVLLARFARLAGVDAAVLERQFTRARSFDDERWIGQWAAAADSAESPRAAVAYRLLSWWPGGTSARRDEYDAGATYVDAVLSDIASRRAFDLHVEHVTVDGRSVRVHILFPDGAYRCPVVLVVGGLDATAQETVLSMLDHTRAGLAVAVIESPASGYSTAAPMTRESYRICTAVVEHLGANPGIDGDRIGMLGLSFGARFVVQIAAAKTRLRCAVVSGFPGDRSLGPAAAVGVPAIMMETMRGVLGVRRYRDIGPALNRLSIRHLYGHIDIPLLVVNGAADTIARAADSRDLADAATFAELRLYPGDDHCAVRNFDDWVDYAMTWLSSHLISVARPA